jgi:late competence protein required for DNA uptake (superfamily II DNA/RNA helicase)
MVKNFGIKNIESACEQITRRMKVAHYTLVDSACERAKEDLKQLRKENVKILETGRS